MLHNVLAKLGIYYAKRRYMPRGIDWAWDIRRMRAGHDLGVAFDVGANIGQTTALLLETFPGAAVHAFEPVKTTFDRLQRRFANAPHFSGHRLAVSDQSGTVQVLSDPESQLNHIVARADLSTGDVEAVEAVTVDSFCVERGIAHIDILKIDTEGHELQVLHGAREMFRQGQVDWVFAEVTFDPGDRSHSSFSAVEAWLAGHGLAVWCFYEHYHTGDGDLLFCNALFARRSGFQRAG